MRNVSQSTDNNTVNSIDLELTDLAQVTLESDADNNPPAEKHVSPAVAAWNARVEATELVHVYDDDTLLDSIAARPEWSNPALDKTGTDPNSRSFSSESATTALSMHHGWRIDAHTGAQSAALVRIVKMQHFAEPTIHLARSSGHPGDEGTMRERLHPGSGYFLTLDEAADIAHTLLAAVDTARGIAD
ncbi:hypothetical protein [Rhodococcus erythropolis]|uniref:hypothetical protein n=1 Tax=Rhodococcus erythropolis TaxID=1833 RepID=UPI00366E834E